ncbi:hypothetical protein HYE54_12560 [Aggregatibacter actinomycetemcomitans]|uniref:hypothetical protein n=1 Tax=Aggregatibacter actinomycetemcomitans TaxID=714 RepID=UPI00197B1F27|nr:hypothetical protein [Aggregatibacter actinomycetemcomitans]MBN6069519.1 hypothetical protein [Aggregatibacter actinomycetemcomitans]MBN6086221.1 hypothetical protein [Aggregatibacter actinomycetemcomitans]
MERQYGADMVSRNVKQLGNGVIEISRYSVGHLKANLAWPWFLIVSAITLYDVVTQTGMFNDIQWAISVDWALEDTWNLIISTKKEFGEPIVANAYEKFKIGMLEAHPSVTYRGWFYILFPLFWFVLLALPKWRPVRIDSRRRLIYFWWWGRFYIKQYPQALKHNRQGLTMFLQSEFHNSWMHRVAMGSLVLHIPHENPRNKKRVAVPLGTYRPVCEYQNRQLREFIIDYLQSPDGDKELALYFKKEKCLWQDYFGWFYHFSLFPALSYNEKKTEAKIRAWLEKYGDGQ